MKKPDDVSESVWKDHLAIRKAKRIPMTATALDALRREAEKVGWSLQKALTESCERGWASFKADWILNSQNQGRTTNGNAARLTRSQRADIASQRALDELEHEHEEGEE